jgi:hypothetical protein
LIFYVILEIGQSFGPAPIPPIDLHPARPPPPLEIPETQPQGPARRPAVPDMPRNLDPWTVIEGTFAPVTAL